MPIPLTPRAWSGYHAIEPTRLERGIAAITIFVLSARFPLSWIDSTDQPGLSRIYPGWYFLATLIGLLLLAVTTIGWNPSGLVTAMRLEPLLPVFMVWVLLSSLWADNPGETFRDVLYVLVTVALGYWLAVRFSITALIGLTATVMCFVVAVQFVFIFGLPTYGIAADEWVGTYLHKNLLGRMMALVALMLVLAARTFRHRRAVLWPFAVAAVVLAVGSNSKTGLLAVIGVPLLLAFFSAFRARKTLYGAVAMSIVGGGAIVAWVGLENRATIAQSLGKQPTLTGRTQVWSELLQELGRRPLHGFGFEAYWTGFGGPSTGVLKRLGWVPAHAHNAFFQLWMEIGAIGFVLFLAIIVRLLVRGARVVRWYRGAIGLFPLVFGVLVVLVSITEPGIVFHNAFLLFLVPACIGAARGRRDVLSNEQSIALRLHGASFSPPPAQPVVALDSSL